MTNKNQNLIKSVVLNCTLAAAALLSNYALAAEEIPCDAAQNCVGKSPLPMKDIPKASQPEGQKFSIILKATPQANNAGGTSTIQTLYTYSMQEKVCPGNNIKGFPFDPKVKDAVTDINTCAKKCDEHPFCKSFSFNDTNKQCIIKDAITTGCTLANTLQNRDPKKYPNQPNQYDITADSSKPSPTPEAPSGYSLAAKICVILKNIPPHAVFQTANDCAKKCDGNAACKAFSYNIINQSCIINSEKTTECKSVTKDRSADGLFQFDRQ